MKLLCKLLFLILVINCTTQAQPVLKVDYAYVFGGEKIFHYECNKANNELWMHMIVPASFFEYDSIEFLVVGKRNTFAPVSYESFYYGKAEMQMDYKNGKKDYALCIRNRLTDEGFGLETICNEHPLDSLYFYIEGHRKNETQGTFLMRTSALAVKQQLSMTTKSERREMLGEAVSVLIGSVLLLAALMLKLNQWAQWW